MGHLFVISIVVALIAIIVSALYSLTRTDLPSHLFNNHVEFLDSLITATEFDDLNSLLRHMKHYPSNIAADLKTGGYKVSNEHIGEATPMRNNSCHHPFLVPSKDGHHCELPQRVDVGKHFVLTGGPDGIREPYDRESIDDC